MHIIQKPAVLNDLDLSRRQGMRDIERFIPGEILDMDDLPVKRLTRTPIARLTLDLQQPHTAWETGSGMITVLVVGRQTTVFVMDQNPV